MIKKFKLLHITYDLRDRLKREKTTAVKNLIDISAKIGYAAVIDLVRVPFLHQEKLECSSSENVVIDSFGLPYGLFLKRTLDRVLGHIFKAEQSGFLNLNTINIVHAHKLTYEGYIGFKICKKLNLPLVISLRQTDTMVLNRKPHLLNLYKEILSYSSTIFYLNPYTKVVIEKRLGTDFYNSDIKNKMVLLPNIVERELPTANQNQVPRRNLITILRMDKKSVKRKNIKRLLEAFSLINDEDLKLNIIGSGDYIYKVKSWVKKYKLLKRVNFLGRISNKEIDTYYRSSLAFLLPSLSESFGLVYAEALINGTPILYSKNCLGFDGYFDNVGAAVDPLSVNSIRDGILDCISKNLFYQETINELNRNDAFKIFSSSSVQKIYSEVLNKIIN